MSALRLQPDSTPGTALLNMLFGGLDRGLGCSLQAFQRQAPAAPTLESAGKGSDARDALALEKKRRTGAAGFVRSGAVEHDIPIARDLLLPVLDFCRENVDRARQSNLFRFHVQLVPEVDDGNILARRQF